MQVKFIVPWFGRWPWYFPLWAASLERNPSVYATIITNLDTPSTLPDNIDIIQMSMEEVLNRVQSATGIKLPACKPHKLCDYKPLYALAFPEVVEGLDYWGYCDMDMIFGDLSPVIQHAKSGKWDIISPFAHVVGHFTLIKNLPRNNSLALRAPNLARRLAYPAITFLDEGGMNDCIRLAGNIHYLHATRADLRLQLPRCFTGATIKHDGLIDDTGIINPVVHMQGNKIFVYDNESKCHEVLYLHFMGKKAKRYQGGVTSSMKSYSYTALGFQPGLIPPKKASEKIYRARVVLANLDKELYRLVRGLVPASAVNSITKIRLQVAKMFSGRGLR